MTHSQKIIGVWLHAYEEDESCRRVFRPSGASCDLGRRPRQRLELRADGTFVESQAGSAGGAAGQSGSWRLEGDILCLKGPPHDPVLRFERVISDRPDRLVLESARYSWPGEARA